MEGDKRSTPEEARPEEARPEEARICRSEKTHGGESQIKGKGRARARPNQRRGPKGVSKKIK